MTHTHLPSSRFGVSTGHIRLHSTDNISVQPGSTGTACSELRRAHTIWHTHAHACVRALALQHGKHQNCTHICASHTRITVAKKHEYYNNILANQRVHSCWNGWCMTVCGWACVRVCACVCSELVNMKSCDFSLQIPNEPTESHATRAHCSTMRFCAHTHGNEFKYLCHFFVVVHTYFSTVSSYTQKNTWIILRRLHTVATRIRWKLGYRSTNKRENRIAPRTTPC